MTDDDKIQGLVGRTIKWADLENGFVHLETEEGLMFHIRVDTDDEYETIEINGDLPN